MEIIALPSGITKLWHYFKDDDYKLYVILNYFKLAYLKVADNQYIDLMKLWSDVSKYQLTPKQIYEQYVDLTIETIDFKTIYDKVRYFDFYTDFEYSLSYQPSTADNIPPKFSQEINMHDYTHLRCYVNNFANHTNLSKRSLFFINGLVHYSTYTSAYTTIHYAQDSINIAGDRNINVLIAPMNVEMQFIKFTNVDIQNVSNLSIPYISDQEDTFILVLAGMLFHTSTKEITYVNNKIIIDPVAMNLQKRLYELQKLMDTSNITIDLSAITDSTTITDTLIKELLSLHNSFIIQTNKKLNIHTSILRKENNDSIYSINSNLEDIRPMLISGSQIPKYYNCEDALSAKYYYTRQPPNINKLYKSTDHPNLPINPNRYMDAKLFAIATYQK